jgi:regulator of sigma E protease
MLSKIAIFILFLGPLVFFHELGHFLFARLFGVRVEVFSIGFGPKILKFKKGFTQYAVSLIPLGGYVKMFGDDPLAKDEMPEAQKKYSFVHKSKMARFWIVFGGPLANFILAYCIFFTLFMTGEKVPEIKIGAVTEKAEFYKIGIRSGDVIKKVNGITVTSPGDIILETDGNIRSLTLVRSGEDVQVNMDMTADSFFEKMSEHPPLLVQPIVKSKDGRTVAISKYEGKVDWTTSLDEMTVSASNNKLFLHELSKLEQKGMTAEIDLTKKPTEIIVDDKLSFSQALRAQGLFPIDLVVRSISTKSAADKAGVKQGDIISKVDGLEVYSFESLRRLIQTVDNRAVEVELIRDGNIIKLPVTPEVKKISGQTVKLIGIYSAGMYVKGKYVNTEPLPLGQAVVRSWNRTIQTVYKTIEGFKKLVMAETSLKNIGGPIAIGKVASDSFNTSLSYFFQLMALISVNLGVINLFPIPVLDGGHIVFIILEVLNGGPLSRRKLEIAQQFGLSLLLLLMVGALFNDFTRFF